MKKITVLLTALIIACSMPSSAQTSTTKWVDASQFPLLGTVCPDAEHPYTRLPDKFKPTIRKDVWQLGQNSAGLAVRFRSDATEVKARWTNTNKFNMNHMTAAGIRGLDLYTLEDGKWTPVGSARPSLQKATSTSTFLSGMDKKMREYMMYLPLYDGIDSLEIGVNAGAVVEQPEVNQPERNKPIVMYGTSILQGGCATRPGMAHTSIIERDLNREVYNLGFSGNARLDPEIAEVMSMVDAGVFVIDPLANLTKDKMLANIDKFYELLRAAHPNTPILMVELPTFPHYRLCSGQRAGLIALNKAWRDFYDKKVAAGDKNLYYYETSGILGDCLDGTVDNYHFTDLGFMTFAKNLGPVIENILEIGPKE